MIAFQRSGSQVLEKDTSELQELHIHSSKSFLVNPLRKGGQMLLEQKVRFPASVLSFLRLAF